MKRLLIASGYGVAGLALAFLLTFGAYALAGQDLSQPAKPLDVGGALAPTAAAAGPSRSGDGHATSTPKPKPSDKPSPKPRRTVTPPPPPPPPPPSPVYIGSSSGGHSGEPGDHQGPDD